MPNRYAKGVVALSLLLSGGGFCNAYAQQVSATQTAGTCTGVVYDEFGDPVIGANVSVPGTAIAAATNIDGEFSLPNVKPGTTLRITYVGYEPIDVKWEGAPLSVSFKQSSTQLDEVVVMGYGVAQKRSKVTNSIAKVSKETLTVGANSNPAQALVGAVSGVKVTVNSGDPSATPAITVRGGTN